MAVKRDKRTKRRRRRLLQAVKGGTLRLRKEPQAAPAPAAAEEPPRSGVLRFDSEGWRLPEALAEAGETESNGPSPDGSCRSSPSWQSSSLRLWPGSFRKCRRNDRLIYNLLKNYHRAGAHFSSNSFSPFRSR